jgi:hypothetical protein
MEIAKLCTYKEVKALLKEGNLDLNVNSIKEQDLFDNGWQYVGNNASNSSTIKILQNGEYGLIERLTNAIDAVIEKQKQINQLDDNVTTKEILIKAFPKYFDSMHDSILKHKYLNDVLDAKDQIILRVLNSDVDEEPTFEIYDAGIGIEGNNFKNTILSLHGLNKTSSTKKYLIGTYGQGGSTSLQFAKATIIFSKINNKIF